MKKQHLAISTTALAVTLALAACGGGGGSAGGVAISSQGVITGFGSVFVNGVEYDIPGGTNVVLDGTSGSEAELKVGMLVTVRGTVNPDGKTGTANAIQYADDMEGVVTANNVAAGGTGTLTVMGQTVNIDARTVFESQLAGVTSADLIQVGNVLEVSGYPSSTGSVAATRIEVKAATQGAGEIEVKGMVTNLTASTFALGTLTVDFSGASAGMVPAGLANGQYVEVKSTQPFDGTGPLMADSIELQDNGLNGHEGAEGEDLEANGVVTVAFDTASSSFELNGRSVKVDANTEYEQGTADQLLLGTEVKAEMHFDADGNLVADSVEFGHEGDLEFASTVESVNASARTVTVMGKTFHVDNNTMMIDNSSNGVRYFSLADLSPAASDFLEIHAYVDPATGELRATKLERDDYMATAKLKGSVSTTGGLMVEGIAVDTSGAGTVPPLADGNIVEVDGTYSGGVLYASAVSLN